MAGLCEMNAPKRLPREPEEEEEGAGRSQTGMSNCLLTI